MAIKIPIIPYTGIYVFWPYLSHVLANRAGIFMGTQVTIIYQLVINHDFDALKKSGGKMDVAATLAPKSLGPRGPTKKLACWVKLLGQPLSQKMLKII